MREIKFRCKIKKDAGIYEVQSICWLNLKMRVARHCGDEWLNFDKIQALMQHTGLQDKNGRDIFDGDICTDHFKSLNRKRSKEPIIIRLPDFYYTQEHMGYDTNLDFEIIGNIYQNPELLAS